MKCLPQNKLVHAKGSVLHDSHAEVLAIRGFNRFLVDECAELAKRGFGNGGGEDWMKWKEAGERGVQHGKQARFELQGDVRIHMYCSEAPCGDASMELVMAQQEDDTPWSRDIFVDNEGDVATSMLGRGHFDRLGIVRRKPARPDAPMTLSKSCSDKLAMKQCTSLLSGLASALIWPGNVYLNTLVLPESQCVPAAVERAFGTNGRMNTLKGMSSHKVEAWERDGYSFTPFEVRTTTKEFDFSRRAGSGAEIAGPSNLSTLITPQREEVLINGVLQGRKQSDPRGASCVSRRRMWESTRDIGIEVGMGEIAGDANRRTYGEMKGESRLEGREKVKSDARTLALLGWRRNVGDEQWTLREES